MDKEIALERLNSLLARGEELKRTYSKGNDFKVWRGDAKTLLRHAFGEESSQYKEFDTIKYSPIMLNGDDSTWTLADQRRLDRAIALLTSVLNEIRDFWSDKGKSVQIEPEPTNAFIRVIHVCERFHVVAKQLLERHDSRKTLEINDEHDVQDLLHAMLRIDFTDVREEESTPSYATSSSRIDFLLKVEGIAVEAKIIRNKSHAKTAPDELIIDKEKYKKHPDYRAFVVLVYDPKNFIANSARFDDLNEPDTDVPVHVVVVPRH